MSEGRKKIVKKGALKKKGIKAASDFVAGAGLDPKKSFWWNGGKTTTAVLVAVISLFGGGGAVYFYTNNTRVDSSETVITNNSAPVFQPRVHGDSNTQVNNFYQTEGGSAIESNGCGVLVCDNFHDLTKWILHPNLSIVGSGPVQLSPIVDGKQRGGVIFYRDLWLRPSFTVVLNITPCGTRQANFEINYAGFKYGLGEGNYKSIKLFSQGRYIAPKGYEKLGYYNLPEPIRPCTQVELRVNVSMTAGPHDIVVKSSLDYVGTSGKRYDKHVIPEFIVSTTGLVWAVRDQFGMGVNDWQKTGDVSVMLQSIQIEEDKL